MKRQVIDRLIAIKNGQVFQKRAWRISVKQLVLNFDTYVNEVELGRTLRIVWRGSDWAVLVPIKKGLKHRSVLRRDRAQIPRKASKRW
jgi:hypothetical protein